MYLTSVIFYFIIKNLYEKNIIVRVRLSSIVRGICIR